MTINKLIIKKMKLIMIQFKKRIIKKMKSKMIQFKKRVMNKTWNNNDKLNYYN